MAITDEKAPAKAAPESELPNQEEETPERFSPEEEAASDPPPP